MKSLVASKEVYEADGNEPIRQSDYVALVDAFESIVKRLRISDAYEIDFRRNLPAGGWRGLQVAPDLEGRISDVREFIESNPVYSSAAAAILSNLIACVRLADVQGVDTTREIAALEPMLTRIRCGELR